METLAPLVPVPAFDLAYNGKGITADIAPFLISATYVDNLSGEADSLDIELEDTDGRWLNAWYPEHGAALEYRFGYAGQQLVLAGTFEIDELDLSGPPSVVRIRALAAGVQKSVRTRVGRGYENTTLAAIAQRIAQRNHMTLVGAIDALQIDRVTQYNEGDLAFLHRLAGQYGYAFKITENNTRMVFWKSSALLVQTAVRRYAPSDLTGWNIRDKVGDVPAAVKVRHHNSRTKTLVTYGVKDGETTVVSSNTTGARASSADTANIIRRAPNQASAEAQGDAELDKQMLEKTAGEIRFPGDAGVSAGINIDLVEFGVASGTYQVTRATHAYTRGAGYATSLELKRAAPPATASAPRVASEKPAGRIVYGMKDGVVQEVARTPITKGTQ